MKMIMAVIKPFKLEDVRQALIEFGIEGLTITEVKGFGRQKGQADIPNNEDYQVSFLPKIKIEVAVPDKIADKVTDALVEAAGTGRIGDGKIFVYDLKDVVRIRTGERGEDAI